MTSLELQAQLNDVQNRVQIAASRTAIASLSVDEKLEAQRRLDELTSLQKHLQHQLAEAQQREEAAQRKREEEALETEMELVRSELAKNRSERVQLCNATITALLEPAQKLDALDGEANALQRAYESKFFERFGRYPENASERLQAEADVEPAKHAEVAALALLVLANELRGGGGYDMSHLREAEAAHAAAVRQLHNSLLS